MDLRVSNQEVASIIEALYDGVLRRIAWSMSDHPSGWRSLDLTIAQTVMDSMMAAYVNIVMTYRESDIERDQAFDAAFTFNDEVMDMLHLITVTKEWDDIPVHAPHNKAGECALCDEIFGRQAGRD